MLTWSSGPDKGASIVGTSNINDIKINKYVGNYNCIFNMEKNIYSFLFKHRAKCTKISLQMGIGDFQFTLFLNTLFLFLGVQNKYNEYLYLQKGQGDVFWYLFRVWYGFLR